MEHFMGYIKKDRSNTFFQLFCLVKVVAINEVLQPIFLKTNKIHYVN
jgi:hypothetical protein